MDSSLTDFVVLEVSGPNSDNILRQQYEEQIMELKSWVNDQTDLDFYQFIAIRYATRTVSMLDFYRVIALVCLQEWAVLYVLNQEISELKSSNEWHVKGWCDTSGRIDGRQLATVLSVFVSMTFYNEILNLRTRGLYSWTEQPCFVSKYWIALGMLLNCVVVLTAWVSSVLILYLADNPLDMVLNSLALYFIVELDDEFVYFGDYKKLANWIEVEYDDFIDRYYENQYGSKQQKCCATNVICTIIRCKSEFYIKIVRFIGNRKYNVFFLLPFAFICPMFMIICY